MTNFSSSSDTVYHELAAWENHLVRGIDFTLLPNRLTIEEIKFISASQQSRRQFQRAGERRRSGKIVPGHQRCRGSSGDQCSTAGAVFPIRVGFDYLGTKFFRLADDSLMRRSETHVEEINRSIRDIVLPGLNKASVNIHGKVSALSPFEIVGGDARSEQSVR